MREQIDEKIRSEIDPKERLLWSGIPRQGFYFQKSDILAVPFSILWGGFAFFWEYQVAQNDSPWFFKLWGIPFVLVGIYIIIGRFFFESYIRSRTYYGLTDQRAIIIGGLTGRDVKSVYLRSLNEVSIQERSDRSGTITFGPSNLSYAMWGRSFPGASNKLPPAFEGVEEVRYIHKLILEAQHKTPAA